MVQRRAEAAGIDANICRRQRLGGILNYYYRRCLSW